jgi:hypothetical protein
MEPFAAMANPPKLPPSVVNSDVAVGHVLGLECKAAFKAEKAGELFIHISGGSRFPPGAKL